MTKTEALITLVTALPEIELAEVMTEIGKHIQREKLEHLIDDVFEIETNEKEIERLEDEISDLEREVDSQRDEIGALKKKLKEPA